MWDGKDNLFYPESQVRKLSEWVNSEDRQVRAIALSGAVLMALRYGERLPKSFLDKFSQWADNELLRQELIEIQKFLFTSVMGLKMQKKLHEEIFDKMHKEQQILREKLGMAEDEETKYEIAEEGNKRMDRWTLSTC